MVESDAGQDVGLELNEEMMKELERRDANFLAGKSGSYTLEESSENMNRYIENKRSNAM